MQKKSPRPTIAGFEGEAAGCVLTNPTNLPSVQTRPLGGKEPDWNNEEGRLLALMFAIDGIIPKHQLGADTIGAAAAALQIGVNGLVEILCKRFAELTLLKPGTQAYNRAEFRNVLYALDQLAMILNNGRRAPARLAAYWLFSSAGVGPHPDLEFWRKLGVGMDAAERKERARGYQVWSSHLRNRVALVRLALKPRSALSQRQRASILGADPLIAMELREAIPHQMRLARDKSHPSKSLLYEK